MYDPVTLDQLRAFVAVADEGSFSAAARKLQRVQSAVSTSMSNLESQLGLPIWDRTTKIAKLTDQGHALLGAARRVLGEVDGLRRVASGMVMGLEASVSLCVEALFPLGALLDLCKLFAKEFPAVDLRIDIQVMSAVSTRVLSGAATLGVASPGGILPGLEQQALSAIHMIPVVSPEHSLAKIRGHIPKSRFADEIQIVLSERSERRERGEREGRSPSRGDDGGVEDRAVLSTRTWRVADLHTKHMMLCAGLGWGNLPEHLVRDDLRASRLVTIRPEPWGDEEHKLYLSAVYRGDTTFGPAHRWLLKTLAELCARDAGTSEGQPQTSKTRRKRTRRSGLG
jgi:DNA-binding transcriptional LysR family regulator